MNIIDRARSLFTGVPAAAYASRRESVRRIATAEAQMLESQATLYDLWARLVDPREKFAGLSGPLPGGADSRRAGKDAPRVRNEQDLTFHRGLSRWLFSELDYYSGLVESMVDYQAGSGFAWVACLRGKKAQADGKPTPEVAAAQATLDEFRRRDAWRSREREIIRRSFRDGEAFVRLFQAPRGEVPACRFVEPEWVAQPPGTNSDGAWSFGVLTDPDDVERPLAYHLRSPQNPGTAGEIVFDGRLSERELRFAEELVERYSPGIPIGRGQVFHFKPFVDRTIKRGVPYFLASLPGYESVQDLIDNTLDTASLQAKIYLIRQHVGAGNDRIQSFASNFQTGTLPGTAPGPSAGGPLLRNVPASAQGTRGPITIDTNDAVNYIPGPTSAGVPNYIAAAQAGLRRPGVKARAPEYITSGDASNGNYASTKEAGSPFVAAATGRQLDLADFEKLVACEVLRLAVLSGALVDGPRFDVEIQPPPVAIRSDLEQAQQFSLEHQAGVRSAASWQRVLNLDPEHERANFQAEREANPDVGLPFNLPGFGGS